MYVRSIDPYSKFFSSFHELYFPGDIIKRKHYYRFHNASLKYEQFQYTYDCLIDFLKDSEDKNGNIEHTDANEIAIRTYLEASILFAKASLDLATSGLLLMYFHDSKVDSISTFINNKLDKDERYKTMHSYIYWKNLKKNLFEDEFYWASVLVRREGNRSMRDLLIHKKSIQVSFMWNFGKDQDKQNIYVTTERSSQGYEIIKEINEFSKDLFDGITQILYIIRAEAILLKE